MTTAPTAPTTRTLDVPGARIAYDVHGDPADLDAGAIPLLLVGAPMAAGGFASLVPHLPDRVVVTHDPRNVGRSTRDQPTAGVSARQHAEDLHALVGALGGGPVDLLGSSGGATNALVLVEHHPEDVRLLVAHEPPLARLLPDAAAIRAGCDAILAAYDAGGPGPAMARFIALVMLHGDVPPDHHAEPTPDPSASGLPVEDDGSRDDPMMTNMRGGLVDTRLDLEALRAAPTRLVVAVGEESGGPLDGEMTGRAAHALAAALGLPATPFPGGHSGFMGGEFGQTGRPVDFAARLRQVLADHA